MTTLYTSRRYTSLAILIGLCTGVFAASSQLWWAYAAPLYTTLVNVEGKYGIEHILGTFNFGGGDGNAGYVRLISTSDEGPTGVNGSGLYLDTASLSYQSMTGNLWLDSVGWVRMENTELIPPPGIDGENVMTPWTLSGYAWSENAGYIDFNADPGSYSGVAYIPGTKTLTGYAWSDTLGYIPFQETTGNITFKNKVKILGNIGGSKSYDTEYALGTKFDSANTVGVINSVRKNIALLTRSLPSAFVNTDLISSVKRFNNIIYYKTPAGSMITDIATKMDDNDSRSFIVEGGDIYINTGVLDDPQVKVARTIIAVKDTNGSGGNIYIKGDVRNIYASLVAEGSIYSGESSAIIYNDTTTELTQLPKYQLYILGSVISRNTIGGSARTPVVCPFVEATCNYANSYKYDWNYFRTFDKTDTPSASDKSGYDDYSVIIEYDSRLIGDPPPGIAN